MAQLATVRNVLTTLDERAPSALYWQLTVLATLGGFLFGYDTSNIDQGPARRGNRPPLRPAAGTTAPVSAGSNHTPHPLKG
jgi:hypothetical protein